MDLKLFASNFQENNQFWFTVLVKIFKLDSKIANYAAEYKSSTITNLFYKKLPVLTDDIVKIISKFHDLSEENYTELSAKMQGYGSSIWKNLVL
jgi:hypothetical protein